MHNSTSNPLPYRSDHVILDGVKGWGQYVGTYLAWGTHNNGWWGEGEVKFFIDGDGNVQPSAAPVQKITLAEGSIL